MYILSKSNVCCVIARYVDKELNFLTRQSLFLFVITYLESQKAKMLCCKMGITIHTRCYGYRYVDGFELAIHEATLQ